MYASHWLHLAMTAAVLMLGAASPAGAVDNFWLPTGTANWNLDANWSEGGVPAASPFQEVALINNGGTAFVQDTPPQPGGITLGRAAGESGTLEIRSGGNLTAVPALGGVTNGALVVGQAGAGTLRVLNGGRLAAASIQSAAGSSIALSGNAQLISNATTSLNGATNITGQTADFATATNLTFGNSSALQLQIAGTAAPLIKAGGNANLGGTLTLDFGGATPAVGSSWNILDAADINGSFTQISMTTGSLPLGQRFRVREVPGGMNGALGQLLLEQLLVLEINRDTGAMRITNPVSGAPAVAFDSYAITSSHGSFNTANGSWTSLTDQAIANWIEANPQPTQLAEIKLSGTTSVSGGGQLSLGTPWNPQPAQFGQSLEDVVFRYGTPNGEVLTAPVVYTGVNVNNMALIVDPATGQAQLRNASNFTTSIEGYSVISPSGQLTPAGWISLQDNPAASAWLEANPTTNAVSEFKLSGVETMSGNKAFNLGQLFNAGGIRDLVFRYLPAGAAAPLQGIVIYGAIPAIPDDLPGDFNNDGRVDAADYVVWRKTDGTPGGYNTWRANFGTTAPGAGAAAGVHTTAVPEPGMLALLLTLAVTTCVVRSPRANATAA